MYMNTLNHKSFNFKVDYYSLLNALDENDIIIISRRRLIECIKLTILISIHEFLYSLHQSDYLAKKIKELNIDLTYELDKLATESRMDVYEAQTNISQISIIDNIIKDRFNINLANCTCIPDRDICNLFNDDIYHEQIPINIEIYDVFPYDDIFIINISYR